MATADLMQIIQRVLEPYKSKFAEIGMNQTPTQTPTATATALPEGMPPPLTKEEVESERNNLLANSISPDTFDKIIGVMNNTAEVIKTLPERQPGRTFGTFKPEMPTALAEGGDVPWTTGGKAIVGEAGMPEVLHMKDTGENFVVGADGASVLDVGDRPAEVIPMMQGGGTLAGGMSVWDPFQSIGYQVRHNPIAMAMMKPKTLLKHLSQQESFYNMANRLDYANQIAEQKERLKDQYQKLRRYDEEEKKTLPGDTNTSPFRFKIIEGIPTTPEMVFPDQIPRAQEGIDFIPYKNFKHFVETTPYMNWYKQASEDYGVPLDVVLATSYAESGGNPNAKSHEGALGLMQVMPKTATSYPLTNIRFPGEPIRENIQHGVRYLKESEKWHPGEWTNPDVWMKRLEAYNRGPNAVGPMKSETETYLNRIHSFLPEHYKRPQVVATGLGGALRTVAGVSPAMAIPENPPTPTETPLTSPRFVSPFENPYEPGLPSFKMPEGGPGVIGPLLEKAPGIAGQIYRWGKGIPVTPWSEKPIPEETQNVYYPMSPGEEAGEFRREFEPLALPPKPKPTTGWVPKETGWTEEDAIAMGFTPEHPWWKQKEGTEVIRFTKGGAPVRTMAGRGGFEYAIPSEEAKLGRGEREPKIVTTTDMEGNQVYQIWNHALQKFVVVAKGKGIKGETIQEKMQIAAYPKLIEKLMTPEEKPLAGTNEDIVAWQQREAQRINTLNQILQSLFGENAVTQSKDITTMTFDEFFAMATENAKRLGRPTPSRYDAVIEWNKRIRDLGGR